MGTSIKRQVSLSGPVTLNDLQQFIAAAKQMNVPGTQVLKQKIDPPYSSGDPRERVTYGNFTLIAEVANGSE